MLIKNCRSLFCAKEHRIGEQGLNLLYRQSYQTGLGNQKGSWLTQTTGGGMGHQLESIVDWIALFSWLCSGPSETSRETSS